MIEISQIIKRKFGEPYVWNTKLKSLEHRYLLSKKIKIYDNLYIKYKVFCNLPIQGGTSSIMACGFMHNISKSLDENWKHPLQPIIVVHDSNTNYVPVSMIFDMRKFYDENYTKYCSKIGPGIFLLFDLLSGYSYETAKEMKQIDEDTIEYKGDAYSILKIYDKIMACKELCPECDKTRDWIVSQMQMITDPMDRFIRELGCNMTKDISKITVRFHRNNNKKLG